MKKDNPELAQKDVLRKLGEMWNALGEKGQAKYKKQAEQLKEAAAAKKKESKVSNFKFCDRCEGGGVLS